MSDLIIDPATDPVGTVRVYPDDDPLSPAAARVIRAGWSYSPDSPVWMWLTGRPGDSDYYLSGADVAGWPIQPWPELAPILHHPHTEETP